MKKLLDYASHMYYSGNPIMGDNEFDSLAELYNYESVGATVVGDSVPHAFPMWSLQKSYLGENEIVLPSKDIVKTPKLDGAAVALYYINGSFSFALTRGDGKEGKDITANMRLLVPDSISYGGLIQVTGEVVAPKRIENARNYAAGALQLKDTLEFSSRDLYFIAYGVKPAQSQSWTEDMATLSDFGFHIVNESSWHSFPQDGTVFRINNYEEFEKLGYTSKHPRGAYALKERASGSITTLMDVEWKVGRSGVVSPVAILEPVKVGDAMVSRATLHNIKYIEDLGLEIGCQVEIVRSGDIIPRVIRKL